MHAWLHSLLLAGSVAIGILAAEPARAGCAEPSSAADLQRHLDEAESALGAVDTEQFKAQVLQAETALVCIDELLPTYQIADFHRVYGLRAVGARDDIAERAFAAARRLEPRYRFPETLVPSGSPILDAYERAPLDGRTTERVPPPADGMLFFDGAESLDRPTSWPTLVQHRASDGSAAFTAYLRPGEPLPTYEAIPRPPDTHEPAARGLAAHPDAVPFVIAGSATGLATAIVYGIALQQQGRYKDATNNPVPDSELPALRSRTNALVAVSGLTFAATVGAGVAVAIKW